MALTNDRPFDSPPRVPGPSPRCRAGLLRTRLAHPIPRILVVVSALATAASACSAEEDSNPAALPIREVTVFKDGHAFVRHAGAVTLDDERQARLDQLPKPLMGAFWVASLDPGLLESVVAGWRSVEVERKGRDLVELLEANVGHEVIITEVDGRPYSAHIEDLPFRRPGPDAASPTARPAAQLLEASSASPIPASTPHAGPGPTTDRPALTAAPASGTEIVTLRLNDGMRAVPLNRIRDLTFPDRFEPYVRRTQSRAFLTLQFASAMQPGEQAHIGMGYVQRGLRWIPSYRLEIQDGGRARVTLQATLINELADLEDVHVNLVVGVPTFRFKDTLDPMALQEAMTQLSSYFREADRRNLAGFMSNALMSQTMRMGEYAAAPAPAAGPDAGPDPTAGQAVEDLFVWSLEHVTLRRGDRMVLPVQEFDVTCQDRFVLEVPISPLPEMRQYTNSQYEAELVKLLTAPRVMHRLRISNPTSQPLTTAPMLMIRDGRPLGQALITYTPPHGIVEVDVTAAVGIGVAKRESEIQRIPRDHSWRDNWYQRIELQGALTLTNFKEEPVDITVIRHVLGHPDQANHDATIRKQNVLELTPSAGPGGLPEWWHWYHWPWWWWNVNGVGRVEWNVNLQPGQSSELTYAWHYYYP